MDFSQDLIFYLCFSMCLYVMCIHVLMKARRASRQVVELPNMGAGDQRILDIEVCCIVPLTLA